MALDQSGLLEVLDALKAADVVTGPPGRRNVYQALIEAELTDMIGAALHERTESRINVRTVTAPASCPPRRGIGPRAARPARPAPGPARRSTSTVPPAWVAPHPLAGLPDPRCGRGSKVRVLAQHRLLQRAQRGRRWRWGCRCATTSW